VQVHRRAHELAIVEQSTPKTQKAVVA
jgi:hypothetical protein